MNRIGEGSAKVGEGRSAKCLISFGEGLGEGGEGTHRKSLISLEAKAKVRPPILRIGCAPCAPQPYVEGNANG